MLGPVSDEKLGGPAHVDSKPIIAPYELIDHINLDLVSCLNVVNAGSGRWIFKTWENRDDTEKYITSERADLGLLVNIPFTGNVKLKRLAIIGEEGPSHPAAIFLYKNKPHMGFDDVNCPPDEHFEIAPHSSGLLEYSLRAVKFSSCYHLSIYFPKNFGADATKLYYIGLQGELISQFSMDDTPYVEINPGKDERKRNVRHYYVEKNNRNYIHWYKPDDLTNLENRIKEASIYLKKKEDEEKEKKEKKQSHDPVEVDENVEDKALQCCSIDLENKQENEESEKVGLDPVGSMRIMVCGLNNAGKSAVVKYWKFKKFCTTKPTVGFDNYTVTYNDLMLKFYDLSGHPYNREFWSGYSYNTKGVIYVVDSKDESNILLAKKELHNVLKDERLKNALLLVLANKNDLTDIMSPEEITNMLDLNSIRDHVWSIHASSATTGFGIFKALNWLTEQLKKKYL